MKQVAVSEFDILSVARALFERPGGRKPAMLASLLRQKRELPGGMGPTSLGLLRDTLSKGMVLALVLRGGWQRVESLDGDCVLHGRLWQRHAPPPLHLSPFALHLLRWLVAQPLRSERYDPLLQTPATPADEFLLYLALDLTHQARCASALAEQAATQSSALCWLGFADVMAVGGRRATSAVPADISVYAFAPWTGGSGTVFLEALQADLARRWMEMERDKRRLGDPARLIALGRVQDAVLRAYFGAAQGAERRDLCRFILSAARALMDERTGGQAWQPVLAPGGSLRARSQARRSSVALLRNLRTIKHWADEAASLRFFDDEYQTAQMFLRLWEHLGEARYRQALALVVEIESIDGLVDNGPGERSDGPRL